MGVVAVVQAIAAVGSFLYQRQAQKKAERKARERAQQAREASLGQQVRPSGSAEPINILYGYTATNGTNVYVNTGNNFRNTSVTFTEQHTDSDLLPRSNRLPNNSTGKKNQFLMSQTVIGLGQIDKIITFDVDGTDHTEEEYENAIYISVNRATNTADLAARVFTSDRTSTDTFTDLSYTTNIFKLDREDPQFNGVPSIYYYLRGNRVYDPRDSSQVRTDSSTWKFSNNAVLVLLDFLMSDAYGPGWDYNNDIDVDSFIAAADLAGKVGKANAAIGGKVFDGETSRDILRYEFNGALDSTATDRDNIEEILAVIPGVEFFRAADGKWKIVVPNADSDEATQSVKLFDEDELVSGITVSYPETDSRLNQQIVKFSNASKDFAADTLTRPRSSSSLYQDWLDEDNDLKLNGTLSTSSTSNIYNAANLALQNTQISRLESYEFEVRPTGYVIEPGDIVQIRDPAVNLGEGTNASPNIYVKVGTVNVMSNLNVKIRGVRFSNENYQFVTTADEVIVDLPQPSFVVGNPVGISAIYNSDLDRIAITWKANDSEDSAVIYYEVFWKLSNDSEANYTLLTQKPVSASDTETVYHTAVASANYEYIIRAVTRDNRRSGYSNTLMATSTGIEVEGSQGLPGYSLFQAYADSVTDGRSTGGVEIDNIGRSLHAATDDFSWPTGQEFILSGETRNVEYIPSEDESYSLPEEAELGVPIFEINVQGDRTNIVRDSEYSQMTIELDSTFESGIDRNEEFKITLDTDFDSGVRKNTEKVIKLDKNFNAGVDANYRDLIIVDSDFEADTEQNSIYEYRLPQNFNSGVRRPDTIELEIDADTYIGTPSGGIKIETIRYDTNRGFNSGYETNVIVEHDLTETDVPFDTWQIRRDFANGYAPLAHADYINLENDSDDTTREYAARFLMNYLTDNYNLKVTKPFTSDTENEDFGLTQVRPTKFSPSTLFDTDDEALKRYHPYEAYVVPHGTESEFNQIFNVILIDSDTDYVYLDNYNYAFEGSPLDYTGYIQEAAIGYEWERGGYPLTGASIASNATDRYPNGEVDSTFLTIPSSTNKAVTNSEYRISSNSNTVDDVINYASTDTEIAVTFWNGANNDNSADLNNVFAASDNFIAQLESDLGDGTFSVDDYQLQLLDYEGTEVGSPIDIEEITFSKQGDTNTRPPNYSLRALSASGFSGYVVDVALIKLKAPLGVAAKSWDWWRPGYTGTFVTNPDYNNNVAGEATNARLVPKESSDTYIKPVITDRFFDTDTESALGEDTIINDSDWARAVETFRTFDFFDNADSALRIDTTNGGSFSGNDPDFNEPPDNDRRDIDFGEITVETANAGDEFVNIVIGQYGEGHGADMRNHFELTLGWERLSTNVIDTDDGKGGDREWRFYNSRALTDILSAHQFYIEDEGGTRYNIIGSPFAGTGIDISNTINLYRRRSGTQSIYGYSPTIKLALDRPVASGATFATPTEVKRNEDSEIQTGAGYRIITLKNTQIPTFVTDQISDADTYYYTSIGEYFLPLRDTWGRISQYDSSNAWSNFVTNSEWERILRAYATEPDITRLIYHRDSSGIWRHDTDYSYMETPPLKNNSLEFGNGPVRNFFIDTDHSIEGPRPDNSVSRAFAEGDYNRVNMDWTRDGNEVVLPDSDNLRPDTFPTWERNEDLLVGIYTAEPIDYFNRNSRYLTNAEVGNSSLEFKTESAIDSRAAGIYISRRLTDDSDITFANGGYDDNFQYWARIPAVDTEDYAYGMVISNSLDRSATIRYSQDNYDTDLEGIIYNNAWYVNNKLFYTATISNFRNDTDGNQGDSEKVTASIFDFDTDSETGYIQLSGVRVNDVLGVTAYVEKGTEIVIGDTDAANPFTLTLNKTIVLFNNLEEFRRINYSDFTYVNGFDINNTQTDVTIYSPVPKASTTKVVIYDRENLTDFNYHSEFDIPRGGLFLPTEYNYMVSSQDLATGRSLRIQNQNPVNSDPIAEETYLFEGDSDSEWTVLYHDADEVVAYQELEDIREFKKGPDGIWTENTTSRQRVIFGNLARFNVGEVLSSGITSFNGAYYWPYNIRGKNGLAVGRYYFTVDIDDDSLAHPPVVEKLGLHLNGIRASGNTWSVDTIPAFQPDTVQIGNLVNGEFEQLPGGEFQLSAEISDTEAHQEVIDFVLDFYDGALWVDSETDTDGEVSRLKDTLPAYNRYWEEGIDSDAISLNSDDTTYRALVSAIALPEGVLLRPYVRRNMNILEDPSDPNSLVRIDSVESAEYTDQFTPPELRITYTNPFKDTDQETEVFGDYYNRSALAWVEALIEDFNSKGWSDEEPIDSDIVLGITFDAPEVITDNDIITVSITAELDTEYDTEELDFQFLANYDNASPIRDNRWGVYDSESTGTDPFVFADWNNTWTTWVGKFFIWKSLNSSQQGYTEFSKGYWNTSHGELYLENRNNSSNNVTLRVKRTIVDTLYFNFEVLEVVEANGTPFTGSADLGAKFNIIHLEDLNDSATDHTTTRNLERSIPASITFGTDDNQVIEQLPEDLDAETTLTEYLYPLIEEALGSEGSIAIDSEYTENSYKSYTSTAGIHVRTDSDSEIVTDGTPIYATILTDSDSDIPVYVMRVDMGDIRDMLRNSTDPNSPQYHRLVKHLGYDYTWGVIARNSTEGMSLSNTDDPDSDDYQALPQSGLTVLEEGSVGASFGVNAAITNQGDSEYDEEAIFRPLPTNVANFVINEDSGYTEDINITFQDDLDLQYGVKYQLVLFNIENNTDQRVTYVFYGQNGTVEGSPRLLSLGQRSPFFSDSEDTILQRIVENVTLSNTDTVFEHAALMDVQKLARGTTGKQLLGKINDFIIDRTLYFTLDTDDSDGDGIYEAGETINVDSATTYTVPAGKVVSLVDRGSKNYSETVVTYFRGDGIHVYDTDLVYEPKDTAILHVDLDTDNLVYDLDTNLITLNDGETSKEVLNRIKDIYIDAGLGITEVDTDTDDGTNYVLTLDMGTLEALGDNNNIFDTENTATNTTNSIETIDSTRAAFYSFNPDIDNFHYNYRVTDSEFPNNLTASEALRYIADRLPSGITVGDSDDTEFTFDLGYKTAMVQTFNITANTGTDTTPVTENIDFSNGTTYSIDLVIADTELTGTFPDSLNRAQVFSYLDTELTNYDSNYVVTIDTETLTVNFMTTDSEVNDFTITQNSGTDTAVTLGIITGKWANTVASSYRVRDSLGTIKDTEISTSGADNAEDVAEVIANVINNAVKRGPNKWTAEADGTTVFVYSDSDSEQVFNTFRILVDSDTSIPDTEAASGNITFETELVSTGGLNLHSKIPSSYAGEFYNKGNTAINLRRIDLRINFEELPSNITDTDLPATFYAIRKSDRSTVFTVDVNPLNSMTGLHEFSQTLTADTELAAGDSLLMYIFTDVNYNRRFVYNAREVSISYTQNEFNSDPVVVGFSTSPSPNSEYLGVYQGLTRSFDPAVYQWSLFKGTDGKDGETGPPGPPGDDGVAGTDAVQTAEGILYYTTPTLQSSPPAAPTASSYNYGQDRFVGLTEGWQAEPVRVLISDSRLVYWHVRWSASRQPGSERDTITFGRLIPTINFGTTIQSDNFQEGRKGWRIQRDNGDAEFNNVTARGNVSASGILTPSGRNLVPHLIQFQASVTEPNLTFNSGLVSRIERLDDIDSRGKGLRTTETSLYYYRPVEQNKAAIFRIHYTKRVGRTMTFTQGGITSQRGGARPSQIAIYRMLPYRYATTYMDIVFFSENVYSRYDTASSTYTDLVNRTKYGRVANPSLPRLSLALYELT